MFLQIVYTLSKGAFSTFLACSDLGSLKHQTDAEVKDDFRICEGAVDKYKTPLASIDVDNAARPMASRVALQFKTE